jgi:hypothetical protein
MWKATLDDGTTATEESGTPWGLISQRVRGLGFVHQGVEFSLPLGQKEYLQAKSAAAPLCGGKVQIESRWIGFRTQDGKVFRLRFHEASGNVSVETD